MPADPHYRPDPAIVAKVATLPPLTARQLVVIAATLKAPPDVEAAPVPARKRRRR